MYAPSSESTKKLQKETENSATAMKTRAEWKREAAEKAAKVAEASTTAKRFTASTGNWDTGKIHSDC